MCQLRKDLERDVLSIKIEIKWQEHAPGRGTLCLQVAASY